MSRRTSTSTASLHARPMHLVRTAQTPAGAANEILPGRRHHEELVVNERHTASLPGGRGGGGERIRGRAREQEEEVWGRRCGGDVRGLGTGGGQRALERHRLSHAVVSPVHSSVKTNLTDCFRLCVCLEPRQVVLRLRFKRKHRCGQAWKSDPACSTGDTTCHKTAGSRIATSTCKIGISGPRLGTSGEHTWISWHCSAVHIRAVSRDSVRRCKCQTCGRVVRVILG